MVLLLLIITVCGLWAWDNQSRVQLWLAGKPDPVIAPMLAAKTSTRQIEFKASWLSPISRFAYRVEGVVMPRDQYEAAMKAATSLSKTPDASHPLFKRTKTKAYQQSDYVMTVTISRVPRENPFAATPVAEIAPVESMMDVPITHDQFQRLLTALEQGPWVSATRYEEETPHKIPTVAAAPSDPHDIAALKSLSVYREITYTNAAGSRVMLSSTSMDANNALWNRYTQNRHSASNSPALTTVLDELFAPLESHYRDLEPVLDSKLPKAPAVTPATEGGAS